MHIRTIELVIAIIVPFCRTAALITVVIRPLCGLMPRGHEREPMSPVGAARIYNQDDVSRSYTPGKCRLGIYWTWTYPRESLPGRHS